MSAGDTLRNIRNRLGLTIREVEALSHGIADREGNKAFRISRGEVTLIENGSVREPGAHKAFSLACIYGISLHEIQLLYGIDPQKIAVYHTRMPAKKTHLMQFERPDELKGFELPTRVSAALDLNQTTLLPQMLGPWANVPAELLRYFDFQP